MQSKSTHLSNAPGRPNLTARSLALCRKAVALTRTAKARILSEYRNKRQEQQHLVHLALNEAEALAWETDYPYLLFPTLAAEKVQGVLTWLGRQQFIHRTQPRLTWAHAG